MNHPEISLPGRPAFHKPAPKVKAPPTEPPALIVFGRDEAGKAHASYFAEADADLARKAAALMGFHALGVTAGGLAELAATLPAGRVFASGRGFVPFVKQATYEALAGFAGVPIDAAPLPRAKPAKIASSDDQAATDQSVEHHRPKGWDDLKVGSLVLAPEHDPSWWQAVIVEMRPENLFVVRWLGWPDEPLTAVKLEDLALLHPTRSEG